jgi:hypothetical protein
MGTSSFITAAQAPIPRVQAAAEQTLTGCLTKESGDAYILQASDGTKLSVTGPAELAKHVDQTVRLKGTMDRSGGVFRVTAVESVEASCRA